MSKKKKLTNQQIRSNYGYLFEIADQVLMEHKQDFYPDFKELEEVLEELSGSNFYKRWDMKSPEEEKAECLMEASSIRATNSCRKSSGSCTLASYSRLNT